MTQYIVASRHDRGMEYAREHGIPNSQVNILHTGSPTATRDILGKRLSRADIHYVDGWDEGKYASQVQADIFTRLAVSDV
jgi:hypothetical protein